MSVAPASSHDAGRVLEVGGGSSHAIERYGLSRRHTQPSLGCHTEVRIKRTL